MNRTVVAPCPECGERPPAADVAAMTLPTPFLVVGYGRMAGGEIVDPDTLCVDAYGMAILDGRALTWRQVSGPDESPALEFPDPLAAAAHWGGELLWPDGDILHLRHDCTM